jgi:hypothetical protein
MVHVRWFYIKRELGACDARALISHGGRRNRNDTVVRRSIGAGQQQIIAETRSAPNVPLDDAGRGTPDLYGTSNGFSGHVKSRLDIHRGRATCQKYLELPTNSNLGRFRDRRWAASYLAVSGRLSDRLRAACHGRRQMPEVPFVHAFLTRLGAAHASHHPRPGRC